MKCPRIDYCDVYDRKSKRCREFYEKCSVFKIEEDREIREQIQRDLKTGCLGDLCLRDDELNPREIR